MTLSFRILARNGPFEGKINWRHAAPVREFIVDGGQLPANLTAASAVAFASCGDGDPARPYPIAATRSPLQNLAAGQAACGDAASTTLQLAPGEADAAQTADLEILDIQCR